MGFIYKITNKINGKYYIGQTLNDVEERWKQHCEPNSCKKSLIGRAIKKYNKDNFNFEIIAKCENDKINELEWYYVKIYNSLFPNGYNLKEGGGSKGKASELTKRKISLSKIGVPALHLKGKPKTPEHIEKLRLAKLGKKQTKSHIENARITRIGKRLKPIIAINVEKNQTVVFSGIKEAIEAGFDRSSIHRVLCGTFRLHKGYQFRYLKEIYGT